MKNRKAPGIDGINTMFKCVSINVKQRILQLQRSCWRGKKLRSEWKVAKIILIYKKGEWIHCENYRGMSVLNILYKICSGFRRRRSCSGNIFIIRQLIEKHREFNNETHILFVDYTKAY